MAPDMMRTVGSTSRRMNKKAQQAMTIQAPISPSHSGRAGRLQPQASSQSKLWANKKIGTPKRHRWNTKNTTPKSGWLRRPLVPKGSSQGTTDFSDQPQLKWL